MIILFYDNEPYSRLNLLQFLSLLCKWEKQFIPFMISLPVSKISACVNEAKLSGFTVTNHFIHGRLQPAEIYCYDSAVLKQNCSEHKNN